MAEGKAKAIEEKVATIEIVARATKVEATRAIESYKESANFKDEIGEATCDAFEKVFEEYKRKISKVFNLLDLSEISVNKPMPLVEAIEA